MATTTKSDRFSAEEKEAMRDRAKELINEKQLRALVKNAVG